jgi:hypothetical protein
MKDNIHRSTRGRTTLSSGSGRALLPGGLSLSLRDMQKGDLQSQKADMIVMLGKKSPARGLQYHLSIECFGKQISYTDLTINYDETRDGVDRINAYPDRHGVQLCCLEAESTPLDKDTEQDNCRIHVSRAAFVLLALGSPYLPLPGLGHFPDSKAARQLAMNHLCALEKVEIAERLCYCCD